MLHSSLLNFRFDRLHGVLAIPFLYEYTQLLCGMRTLPMPFAFTERQAPSL